MTQSQLTSDSLKHYQKLRYDRRLVIFGFSDSITLQLHAHLSGSISRQCLHEIWKRKKEQNPNFGVEDPLVLMPPGKVDYTLET
jgi:hypothetical protein